jgi:Cdc6-related protein, AAA superfamily ATPase
MIKHNNPQTLINSNEFIKQPVNEASDAIKNNTTRNIILYGPRGAGKTTVLYNCQYRSINTDSPAIFTRFDSVGLFGDYQTRFSKDFIEYYYELTMASKILYFIKTNYGNIFSKYFIKDEQINDELHEELTNFINHSAFNNDKLASIVPAGTFTISLIDRFKNLAGIQDLAIMMDRFDWTDSRSRIAQVKLGKYFDIFDRSIITTDDKTLVNDESARKKINDFSFFEINYGKDLDTVKKIIEASEKNYEPKEDFSKFPFKLIPEEAYEVLMKKSNGNISIILSTINELNIMWQWHQGDLSKFDFVDQMEICINNKISIMNKVDSMSKPAKLYLKK